MNEWAKDFQYRVQRNMRQLEGCSWITRQDIWRVATSHLLPSLSSIVRYTMKIFLVSKMSKKLIRREIKASQISTVLCS